MLDSLPMRYIVFGAGGIGSALGGMLAHSGRQALLVARPGHAKAISESGLIISTPKEELRISIPAVSSMAEVAPTPEDCILLTVKTQDSPQALTEIAGRLGPKTPIVCMQNGVRNEPIAASRFSRIIGGLVHFNANFLSPGRIERTIWNTIGLGLYPEGMDDLVEQVAADLKGGGFDVHCHPHIMRPKWGKLIANLNNATNAITDRHLEQALSIPEHRQFMADVMEEGIRVADSAGIALDDGGIFDARAMVGALRKQPEKDKNWTISTKEHSYPSTWQDLKLGRRQTEVRFFNGEIAGLGASLGIPTPYNGVLLEVVERMALAGEKPGRYTLDELKAMVAARKQEFEH
jgi:2-dehydropantoate 2-reductase